MTMTEPTIVPAPSLDAVLATRGAQRLGRMSFLRPRTVHRRGAAPAATAPSEEHVTLSDLLRTDAVEPAVEPDATAAPVADAAPEPTPQAAVETVLDVEDVEPSQPTEVPADVTGPVLQQMRAVHVARERLREAEEERLRRHSDLVGAEAELDAALIRMQARLEGLARSARGLDPLADMDRIDDVSDAIALLRTQAG